MALLIPPSITAGESPTWTDSFGDYSAADSWVLTYYFAGPQSFNLVATASGRDFLLTVIAAISLAWAPGLYRFQAFVTKSSQRFMVGDGQFQVLANLSSATSGYETRSETQQLLDLVNAAIKASLNGQGVQEYSIRGRSLKRYSLIELRALRNELKVEVSRLKAAEARANGLGDPRKLYARFGGP